MSQRYSVTAADLSQLGGPMGTERVDTILTATCASLEEAKDFAQRDYRHRQTEGGKLRLSVKPIPWQASDTAPLVHRADLGYIGYTLRPVVVIGEAKPLKRLAILDPDGRIHVFDANETITAARQYTRYWNRLGAEAKLARIHIIVQKALK